MPSNTKDPRNRRHDQVSCISAVFFLTFLFMTTGFLLLSHNVSADSAVETSGTLEELGAEERDARIKMLLERGDRYREEKNYEVARGVYEEVFLLASNNQEASARIDLLKRLMQNEGQSEDQRASRLYEDEIKARLGAYQEEADERLKEKKWGRARLALEKLLLLDPLNEKARALHQELKRAAREAREPDLSKLTNQK